MGKLVTYFFFLFIFLVYPSQPKSLVHTQSANNSIVLRWKLPDIIGELPINYTLHCSSTKEICNARASTRVSRYTPDLKYIFQDLLSYTEYRFRVCSNNDVSLSNAGETEGSCVDVTVKTPNGGKDHQLNCSFFTL